MATSARRALIIPLLVIASIMGGTAQATGETSTTIDSVTATVGTTTVAVSGHAIFTSAAVVVGEDFTDDHDTAVAPLPSGTDLTKASMQAKNPTTLVFELEVANMPSTGGVNEVVNYIWPFDIGAASYELQAHRSAAGSDILNGNVGNIGNPTFSLNTCALDETTGTNTCETATLTGEFTGHSVKWNVPAGQIGAGSGGATLYESAEIAASASFSGVLWYTNGVGGDTMMWDQVQSFVFPAATVQAVIVPATVADLDANPTTFATVSKSTGNFSTTLLKPTTPGDYKVVVKACFGATNCTFSSVPFSVL
jgi:hypothetical protein